MKLAAAEKCPHGMVRVWKVVDAQPRDQIPAIEHCPICDKDASLLGVIPPLNPVDVSSANQEN